MTFNKLHHNLLIGWNKEVQTQWKTKASTLFLVCSVFFLSLTSLRAQENTDLVVDLVNRVGALESEQRSLRGQLDEAHHELSLLHKKMETLNTDVDYRLNNPEKMATEIAPPAPDSLEEAVIVLPPSSTVGEEYEKARSLLEQGDYEAAEKAFSAFVNAHPKDESAGAAQYWLGVSYFVRGQHEKAAATFAKGYKNYPKSAKAADNLLKLAKALALLDRKADACTTLDQLVADYPKAAPAKEVPGERTRLGCQ